MTFWVHVNINTPIVSVYSVKIDHTYGITCWDTILENGKTSAGVRIVVGKIVTFPVHLDLLERFFPPYQKGITSELFAQT
jgi:hypothetical protein